MGTSPPISNQSLGAYMMRLRDPKTGQPLPDERLLPHIGMICKLHKPSPSLTVQGVLVCLLPSRECSHAACGTCPKLDGTTPVMC
jgi:hypothetical protein